jgi:putative membrane protein
MEYLNIKAIVASILYSLIGILILVISFVTIEKLAPEHLWKKIVDEQNVALAIMAAGFMLAVAIIIGLASHG